MKKIVALILLLTVIIAPNVFGDIDLSEEEQEWLDNHPVISYAGDPNWPPIDFFDGSQKGLITDYLIEIEAILDIEIEYVQLESWDAVIKAIEKKEVDMIAGSFHESRKDIMLFSEIIIDVPYIIITRNDFTEDITLSNLHTKTVATVKGWVMNQILTDNHPGITIVEYPSVADALKGISFGNVDVMIQELASVSYEIEKQKITNLKYYDDYPRTVDVRFIVRNDYEILKDILNKALNEMSEKEKDAIYNSWINISVIPFYQQPIYYIIVGIILVLSIMSFVWLKVLHRQIQIKTEALQKELEYKAEIQLQLESSIEQQNEIQHEMILQERMASLGSMVAGISHEVNNPLGVCLTAVSALRSKFDKLQRAYEKDNLTKSQFNEFILQSNEATKMIEENLQRAIQTIGGFKNMAINQMHDEKILIDFCDFIYGIKETMKYELKKKSVKLDVICGDNIVLLGYPGALTQIFTNLILNSLIHGFVNEQTLYNIIVKAAIIERQLIIEYKDNGCGIPEENIEKVFKLFFTTRREEGGSGIGLHIVRNLLLEKFDGTITCMNRDEGGILFTITIPIRNH
ncbi:MAG: transporter substrate-binding domain-containing protein [Clostridiales bacterium]|nr:transporter substrate-binding domain-containing protein [Clostridiales bacterium]